MGYKVVWSDAAIADLHGICSYIAQDNPRAAQRVGVGILEHVRILATFPFIGPAYPRGTQGPLREVVFRPYRIFYDVSEESRQVQILHVWHGARQDPSLRVAEPDGDELRDTVPGVEPPPGGGQ